MKLKEKKFIQIVGMCSIILFGTYTFALAQANDKVIELPPFPVGKITRAAEDVNLSPVMNAVEIVEIRVAETAVTLGQRFAADDIWLKTLTVKMRNVSGQPIIGVRMGFGLPETKNENGLLAFSLEYGKGVSTGIKSDAQKVIIPDEEFELKFNDAQYQRHQKFISERSNITNFSKIWIGITTVKFEDGSVWSSGCLQSKNPNNSCSNQAR